MVAVDEQYPYRLYMPQQDNSTLIIPSIPPVSWGFEHPAQAWQQASGCETGQIWPKKNGKVVWGACKGEVGRYNTVTGQEKHYWVYPQNRYGHDPDEIKYRFPRQTVVYVSPHDERVIYQASHVLHRSIDEGISWDIISPDLTAKEPQYQIVSGNPITRDVTGEEVYSTIYSMIESRLERGVIWVGANDGPVQRHARQRQDLEERDAEGPGRRAHPDRRRLAAHEGPRLHRRLSLHARARPQAVHLPHRQLRRDLDAADRRQERHPDRSPDARHPRGSARRPACSTPAPSSASSSRSTAARTGSRCSRTCRRRRSPTSRCTATTSSSRRWDGRRGSWTTSRRCSSWRRSWPDRAPPAAVTTAAIRCCGSRLEPAASRTADAAGGDALPAARNDPLSQQHGAARRGTSRSIRPSRAVRSLLRQRAWRRHQARSARRARRRRCARGTSRRRRAPARRRRRCADRSRPRRRRLDQHSRRSRHAAHHVGPALSRSVDGADSDRRRRRADGAARQVQRPPHRGRPDDHAHLRAECRIRASPPTA